MKSLKKYKKGALLAIEYILLICLVVAAMCSCFPNLLDTLYSGSDGTGGLVGIANNIVSQLEECCSTP